jgi:hypothetical protein
MSDEIQTEDAAQTDERKGVQAKLLVARAIARALWVPGFKAENPEADKAQIAAAWKALRPAHTKPVLQTLRSLEKRGFTFTAPVDLSGEEA